MQSFPQSQFVVTSDSACYISLVGTNTLTCLDLATGKDKWKANASPGSILTSDESMIYIGSVGLTGVVAYQSASGETVWRKSLDVRNIGDISLVDEKLSVNAATNKYISLDANTGSVEDLRNSFQNTLPFACNESRCFFIHGNKIFAVRNQQDESIWIDNPLWTIRFSNTLDHHPVLENGVILVQPPFQKEVHAYNSLTGDFLWKSEANIVSDFAVKNSVIYYLTDKAELVFSDVMNGEIVDSIQFTPNQLDTRDATGNKNPYFVRVSGDILLIYFGDSWQLFGFRLDKHTPTNVSS